MGFGWLKLSGTGASFPLMAAPYSQTESDAKAPFAGGVPRLGCLAGHPIGWGAGVRLALDVVVTSSFLKKVIGRFFASKTCENTGFHRSLWTTGEGDCEQPATPK